MSSEDRIVYVTFDEMSLRVYFNVVLKDDLMGGFVDLGPSA